MSVLEELWFVCVLFLCCVFLDVFNIYFYLLQFSPDQWSVHNTQYMWWWPESGVHWQWPGPRTCPCQGEDLSWAGETQRELTCALYRCTGLYRQLHTDTDQVNMETPWMSHWWHRWHHGVCWGGEQVSRWPGHSEGVRGSVILITGEELVQALYLHCGCVSDKPGCIRPSYSKPISPISDVMWIDRRSAGLRAAWSCLPPLPMLWFTLGINKSRRGSRIGSWIAIWYLHLSSPFLAPTQALHCRSLAPIYHDIYGMCQTNIQQEIVSWHTFLWVSPDP